MSSTHLTMFIALNTPKFFTSETFTGYHTAVQANNSIYTYVYTSYQTLGRFPDVSVLSHEISEWANDPFAINTAPNWSVADKPWYSCPQTLLEVGDPLDGDYFAVGNYHVQDEAYFSWFARETSSQGYKGQYDILGKFSTVSQPCQATPTVVPATPIH